VSYRAGIMFGPVQTVPTVYCDSPGCEARIEIRAVPPSWFLDGKPPPRWSGYRTEVGKREDFCPHHKPAHRRRRPSKATQPPPSQPTGTGRASE